MARNTGVAIGTAVFIIGLIVIAFTVPSTHAQPQHVLEISASPNEIAINNTTTTINVTVNYSYSYQNPEIKVLPPVVNVYNESTGQNFTYDIISSFSQVISTPSVIKQTQTSQATLELTVNPGVYYAMGNNTYILKIVLEAPQLTYKYGQANVTLIAS